MQKKIQVGLLGLGRTGKQIARVLLEQQDIELSFVMCSEHNANLGKDIGEALGKRDSGILIQSAGALEDSLLDRRVDVVIDFSESSATLENCEIVCRHKVPVVIGTTGFTELQLQKIAYLAEKYKTGVVYAPNITLGVNVLMLLTNLASGILQGYDCTILESHFKGKKDAPSGTAHKIAREVYKGRDYYAGEEQGEIPILAMRAGGIIGRHEVVLAGEHDQVTIAHESFSRQAFAAGALRAIRFIHKKTGYFEMEDVLDLSGVIANYTKAAKVNSKKVEINN
jgi:4-hydroxy-tetrahydrodipicolinate reductase